MHIIFDKVSYFYHKQRKPRLSLYQLCSALKKNDEILDNNQHLALSNISFEATKGDIVGIVGSNGSGKSTLIKLISKILLPDSGHIAINGKVSTLLSLSTGQQQNLTGRENIVLTGLLLGMTKTAINKVMQKIIDFSELGSFIDQPVRTYSSGMKSRLGFSTLVYVDTDILLLDEIFAVGDGIFKQKAKRMMHERVENSKITFLVSHSKDLISSICNKALWLEQGEMRQFGMVSQVLSAYEQHINIRSQ